MSMLSRLAIVALAISACVSVSAGQILSVTAVPSRKEVGKRMTIKGDSLVLASEKPGKLCFDSVVPGTVVVRSTYQPGLSNTVVYKEGSDYVVDYKAGTVARTKDSRIPDFSTNILYGQKNFNHNDFPGFTNNPFFVYVDYETRNGRPFAAKTDQFKLLPKTIAKLKAGGPFKVIAYGDSITAGGEASVEALRFQDRYVRSLQKRFPKAQFTLENGATGGDTTNEGIARLEEKVLKRNPDLVLIGFGMNDHNIPPYGVALDQFERNLTQIIRSIRERTGAEMMVLSTFPPNPDWAHGSHQMEKYAAATKRVAAAHDCAYADIYSTWMMVLARKDPPSLLANNINHPNDFGHWLYLQALEAVGL